MISKRMLIACLIMLICGTTYSASAGKDGANNSPAGFTDITVSHCVTGSLADTSQLFDYKIYFKDSGGNVVTDTALHYTGGVLSNVSVSPPADAHVDLTSPDGIGVFSLKHGQTATFASIPSDWTMCVTVVRDALYVPKFTDSGGEPGQLGVNSTDERPLIPGQRSIAFTNDRLEIILTGIADIEMSDNAFIFMAGIIVLICLAYVIIKRFAIRPR